ncbi:hypothetical protein BDW74DRAFT_51653 [Aspergillus multicolor]|uniref:uncharacterized protein n=1 Tax=Aspergillus multicolor TaxID=41759 RepID=UPI003CCD0DF3
MSRGWSRQRGMVSHGENPAEMLEPRRLTILAFIAFRVDELEVGSCLTRRLHISNQPELAQSRKQAVSSAAPDTSSLDSGALSWLASCPTQLQHQHQGAHARVSGVSLVQNAGSTTPVRLPLECAPQPMRVGVGQCPGKGVWRERMRCNRCMDRMSPTLLRSGDAGSCGRQLGLQYNAFWFWTCRI